MAGKAWFMRYERGGFPTWLAADADADLSVMCIGPRRWSWLMRRDVGEGEAGDLEAAKSAAEAFVTRAGK
jgi:hypothetical protein